MNKVSKRVLGILAVALALLGFAFAGPFARPAVAEGETITVTIHASTRDGDLDDEYAPIVCDSVPKGSTYNDAMAYIKEAVGSNHINLNNSGKYSLYAMWNTKHSFSTYDSADAASNDSFKGNDILDADTDIYIPYRIISFEITIEPPKCGTVINSEGKPSAEITLPEGEKWTQGTQSNYWIRGANNPGAWSGTMAAGNTYYAYVILELPWGYESRRDLSSVKVNGGNFVTNWMYGNRYGFFVSTTAEHDYQFEGITWGADNTTATASYVCANDDTHTTSVDCTVDIADDAAGTTYTATVSAADSPDGQVHTDTISVTKTYNLFVQGIQVTGENYSDVLGDGKVSFDPASNTLTLNGANIEMTLPKDASKVKEAEANDETGILSYLSGNLTINLTGTNTITNATDESGTEKLGIIVKGASSVTYTGGGTLKVSLPNEEAGHHWALVHEQPATVDGVNINVDIPGAKLPSDSHDKVGGIRIVGSNQLSLKNSAKVAINVGTGYAVDNNVQDNGDIDVAEGCMLVAITGGNNGALHGNRWVLPTDASKALGVLVNTEPTATGRTEWDGTTRFENYKYVRIPGVKSVTVNYDLGEGHEELAQAEALKTAIEKRYTMEVIGVEGSVVKIKVPELSDGGTKNTVDRLLTTLRAALNESVGHDPMYGPYYVYDQNEWNFNNAIKTIDNYNSYEEVRTEREQLETDGTMPEEGQTIYALWAKPISEVAVNVESPICGTEVTADLEDPEDPEMGYDPLTQKPQPVVSISTDRVSVNKDEDGWENTWWVDSTKKDENWFTILPPCYTGTMVGDEDYMLVVSACPVFGYYIARDATYTTSNGTVDAKLSHSLDMFADIYITVTAEHEWGEWEVTKPATTTEEGEETRTCKHCDEKETRPISKLNEIVYTNTAGDGNVWTKGSNVTSDFTFKRNVDDQTAFSHFTKAQVDGKDLASADYTAESGSVIIKLNPSFLETLAVGEHTLTAFFDDGNSADAKFTVVEGEKTYKLTFNLDGGSWNGETGPVVTPIPEGVTIVFTDDLPTKTGYTFVGWKDASGKIYKVGDTFEVTADATFTAVWEAAAKPTPKPAPKKATPSTGDAVAFGSMAALAASGFVSLIAAKATRKED